MKEKLKALRAYFKLNPTDSTSGKPELVGSIFFMIISMVLTTLNIVKKVDITMTIATTVLVIGFAISSYLALIKELNSARIVILILCSSIFSMFAIIGGNDGFAILWILLVPIVGSLWIGIKYGTILSAYFQLFLIILLYTPMSKLVAGYYTETFMLRFPLLYLATFGSTTFLMWQREDLVQRLHVESYYDDLTGLRNRRSYNDHIELIKEKGMSPDFTYFSFDLNRLKHANDTYGHQAGDELIQAAAAIIEKNFRDAVCFRTGGDEFIAFSDKINAEKAVEGMKNDTAAWKGKYMPNMSISVGYAKAGDNPELSFSELAILADSRMYVEKDKYYDENGLEKR